MRTKNQLLVGQVESMAKIQEAVGLTVLLESVRGLWSLPTLLSSTKYAVFFLSDKPSESIFYGFYFPFFCSTIPICIVTGCQLALGKLWTN